MRAPPFQFRDAWRTSAVRCLLASVRRRRAASRCGAGHARRRVRPANGNRMAARQRAVRAHGPRVAGRRQRGAEDRLHRQMLQAAARAWTWCSGRASSGSGRWPPAPAGRMASLLAAPSLSSLRSSVPGRADASGSRFRSQRSASRQVLRRSLQHCSRRPKAGKRRQYVRRTSSISRPPAKHARQVVQPGRRRDCRRLGKASVEDSPLKKAKVARCGAHESIPLRVSVCRHATIPFTVEGAMPPGAIRQRASNASFVRPSTINSARWSRSCSSVRMP